jgi:hypothetical protein
VVQRRDVYEHFQLGLEFFQKSFSSSMLVVDRDPLARRIPKLGHKFDSHRPLLNSRRLHHTYKAKLRKFMLKTMTWASHDEEKSDEAVFRPGISGTRWSTNFVGLRQL